jgi:hypothetical protein
MERKEGTVILYTELGNFCLRENLSAQYRLWLALRQLDASGGSYIPYTTINPLAEAFVQTPKRLQQVIHKGMNVFWMDEGDGLRYVSKAKLAQCLGLGWLGDKVQADQRYLYGSLKLLKAVTYACNFVRNTEKAGYYDKKGQFRPGGKTISRKALTEMTGVSRAAQYQYEEMLGIKVETQFAYTEADQFIVAPIGERLATGAGVFLRDINSDGKKELVWQTANRYSTEKLEYAGRSKRAKTDRSDGYGATAGRVGRRFFYDGSVKFKKLPGSSVCVFTHERKGHLTGRYFRYYHVEQA